MEQEKPNKAVSVEELWKAALPTISAYVHAEIFNRHDAEDVLQEVGREIVAGAGKYDPSRSFVNWAFGIARFQVIRHYRVTSRQRTVFSSELVEQLAEAYETLVPKLPARQEALRECIAKLRPNQQDVMHLYYRDNMSQSDIGKVVGMSKTAVGVLIHRTRAALKDCVTRRLGNGAS